MTIIRNGQQIELSPSELVKAWEEHERSIIRYEVETILNESGYTFGNYMEQGSEYESADDFKADFVEMCVESCFDQMTESEVSAFVQKICDTVESNAEDFNLKQEF